jgi:hypothetical protein
VPENQWFDTSKNDEVGPWAFGGFIQVIVQNKVTSTVPSLVMLHCTDDPQYTPVYMAYPVDDKDTRDLE